MELCPDKLSYFIEDISNGISVVNSLKPKKYFKTANLYDCSCECTISCVTNRKGKLLLYCCTNDASYNGEYSIGYFGEDISKNTHELRNFIKINKPIRLNSNCFNGENNFYYINKKSIQPYHTKAIQELSVLNDEKTTQIETMQAQIASMQTTISDLLSRISALES